MKLGLNLSSIIPDSSQACPASFSPFYLGGLRAANFTRFKGGLYTTNVWVCFCRRDWILRNYSREFILLHPWVYVLLYLKWKEWLRDLALWGNQSHRVMIQCMYHWRITTQSPVILAICLHQRISKSFMRNHRLRIWKSHVQFMVRKESAKVFWNAPRLSLEKTWREPRITGRLAGTLAGRSVARRLSDPDGWLRPALLAVFLPRGPAAWRKTKSQHESVAQNL